MTKLKPIKREIRVHGIEAPVNVELDEFGVHFSVKGSHKKVSAGWVQIVEACTTPTDVKSYLMGKPYDLLKSQALTYTLRKEKNAT